MKNIQAIFFDFDGVIIESVDIKGWAFGKLFEDYPEHVDEIISFHHANGGMSRFDKFRYIYQEILQKLLSEEQFQKLCDDFSNLVYQRVLDCEYVPGALEFLKQHHRKLLLFVVSGTPHEEIQKIVEAKGLGQFFPGVFGSPTPKGQWVKKIIEDRRLDPKKALFVGDAVSDFNAARENSIMFVARVKDPKSDVFKDTHVDMVIKDLFGLSDLL